MKRMKTIMIMAALWCGLSAQAGDTFNFDWKQGQADVGDLTVTVTEGEAATRVEYTSQISVNVGVDMKINEHWIADYSPAGTLEAVTLKSAMNGNTRVDITEAASAEGPYLRTVNGRAKTAEREAVDYSYILLFVKPPVAITSLYSELYGKHFEVREAGKNSYIVTDAKNRKHKFTYDENGRLLKADIELSMGRFDLVAR